MTEEYPFKNLVFEGGGTLGTAYVGVMEELEKKAILQNIIRCGGASVGSINAVLFALGYSSSEVWELLKTTNFAEFQDYRLPLKIDSLFRLFSRYGLYPGDVFKQWIGELIAHKAGRKDITFRELKSMGAPDLYLIGTNLSSAYYDVYCALKTPDFPVVDAVRISMSVPLMFSAVRGKQGIVSVDGGVLNNYPVRLFDRGKFIDTDQNPTHTRSTSFYDSVNQQILNPKFQYTYNRETLGFRLGGGKATPFYIDQDQPAQDSITNFGEYLIHLVKAFLNVQNIMHLETDDWHRTIYVDTEHINGYDFTIDLETKLKLVEAGRKGVIEYFKWYDSDNINDYPVNKPDYEIKLQKEVAEKNNELTHQQGD